MKRRYAEPAMAFSVELANRGARSLGQDPERHLLGTPKPLWIPCDDLETAATFCKAYRQKHLLRAENWSGGRVRDATGAIVARIDFDGTIHDQRKAPSALP